MAKYSGNCAQLPTYSCLRWQPTWSLSMKTSHLPPLFFIGGFIGFKGIPVLREVGRKEAVKNAPGWLPWLLRGLLIMNILWILRKLEVPPGGDLLLSGHDWASLGRLQVQCRALSLPQLHTLLQRVIQSWALNIIRLLIMPNGSQTQVSNCPAGNSTWMPRKSSPT